MSFVPISEWLPDYWCPYQVFRGTCLGLPEELQVVLAGDVLQEGLPGCAVGLPMVLMGTQGMGGRG